jgi:hypothetical protein
VAPGIHQGHSIFLKKKFFLIEVEDPEGHPDPGTHHTKCVPRNQKTVEATMQPLSEQAKHIQAIDEILKKKIIFLFKGIGVGMGKGVTTNKFYFFLFLS